VTMITSAGIGRGWGQMLSRWVDGMAWDGERQCEDGVGKGTILGHGLEMGKNVVPMSLCTLKVNEVSIFILLRKKPKHYPVRLRPI